MGFFSITFVLCVIVVAYQTRLSGVWGVDLWGLVVHVDPETLQQIFTRDIILFLLLYPPAYFILYLSPLRGLLAPYKLNKRYPATSLVLTEAARSIRGVAVASLMEYVIHRLTAQETCPVMIPTLLNMYEDRTAASPLPFFVALAVGYAYGDFHFYWTHRLLHVKPLYAMIHSYHHQSFNPDPFSGLSMHAAESALYFSSAFSLSFFIPLWFARLMFMGQILFPLEGHAGYGFWDREETINHYVHHSKFEWNYGSSPLWDKLMGTDYKMGTDKSREHAAAESARLVGGIIGAGFDGAVTSGTCDDSKEK